MAFIYDKRRRPTGLRPQRTTTEEKLMIARIPLAFLLLSIVAAPARAVVQYQNGIDVSNFQGNINWTSVKNAGYTFAFAKATEGVDFVDIRFTQNMTGAKAAGVLIGPYHFARPDSFNTNPADAANEANDFVDAIQPYYQGTNQTLRPVLDMERLAGVGTTAQEKAFLSQWIRNFATVVNNRLGVTPIIYASSNFAKNYFETNINQYPLWLANWTNNTNNPPSAADAGIWSSIGWTFWQYSSTGSVPGISGNVDLDVFNGTPAQLAQFVVPEPCGLAMLTIGFFAIAARRARRSRLA
jgi:lysozyme